MENPLADALDNLSWQFGSTAAHPLRQEIKLVGESYQAIQAYLKLIENDIDGLEQLARRQQATRLRIKSQEITAKARPPPQINNLHNQQYRPSPLSQAVGRRN
ncbi:hypothetical protein DIURU_004187 [Diutina rugosa]|uniref:Uncharacterized protein n=1 Tax=Diutina rugosa TaxID=5481 RepID=A0A642UIT1_DIURU|nr:uncharacterized protein DIURU_004187 [Diutina rugosa]KAA8899704.1 hypothetical protein DIURU_004187 [Diutina rugosa]